jgi:hypothetical protein
MKILAQVKTLSKKTTLSELHKLDQECSGILTMFWRHHYKSQAFFFLWFDFMKSKDSNWEEYIAKWRANYKEPELKPLAKPEIIKEGQTTIQDKLTVQEKIEQIRKKYGN